MNRKIEHIFNHPVFAIAPLLVYVVCFLFIPENMALLSALLVSVMGRAVVKKTDSSLYIYFALLFSVLLLVRNIFVFDLTEIQLFMATECLIVLFLMAERVFSPKRKEPGDKSSDQFFQGTRQMTSQVVLGIVVHLCFVWMAFAVLHLRITVAGAAIILLVILALLLLAEILRLHLLQNRLHAEDWLSVVDEHGNVTGKVAKSVSMELKNSFMHPVVRLALIHQGKLYLKKRSASRLLNGGMLDYPFEKYLMFNHHIDEAIRNMLKREIGDETIPYRFLLKYVFENDITKRLIFLYVSQIDSEEEFARLKLKEGKLWTEKQINDNLGEEIFSETFELEFEYLRNTVLLPYKL